HRILKIDFETKTVNEIIGNGEPGHKNGNYKTTKFFKPRGLYKKENFLYVADYGNHSIRRVDLKNKIVSTVAGTGKNSDDSAKEGNAPTSSLNYPLDITEIENKLYITQMGDNKIVTFDLNTGNLDIFAGNGEKNIKDGDPLFSSLAQPTGIVSKDKDLYFLDSDGNSLRRAETEYSGKIETLIGKSLFDYGDSDGSYNGTKLQFPMGIFLKEEKLYIADSFNNKIKEVDLTAKKVTSLKAYEKQKKFSWIKKEANFNEPSSILIKNGNAIISDTNNHSLQLLNLEKKEVSEYFLNFPVEIIEPFLKLKLDKIKETIEIPEETISITAPKIELNLELPKDYVWAENIPTFVKVESSNKNFLELKSSVQGSIQKFDGKISASIKTNLGESNLTWLIITHYYEEKKKIQLVKKIKINTRIKIRSGGKANPILKTTLPFKNVF
ncbi:MAG: hypothetical protein KDK36_12890, partial [Leptospiraceae bacterium]|nr:hypothetical protein [Leptospiraceae bacterium]